MTINHLLLIVNVKSLKNYSTLIFDLDNTIYDEIEYLSRAYSFIGKNISELYKDLSAQEIFVFLLNEFKSNGRKNLYEKLITKFKCDNYSLPMFFNDLRNVPIPKDSIPIYGDLNSFISDNINKYKFFIATNGNIIQQENKFRSVNIPHKNQFNIVYCDSFGADKRKPSPFFIIFISTEFHIGLNEMIFIGDSEVDYSAAVNGKIDFLKIEEFNKIMDEV